MEMVYWGFCLAFLTYWLGYINGRLREDKSNKAEIEAFSKVYIGGKVYAVREVKPSVDEQINEHLKDPKIASAASALMKSGEPFNKESHHSNKEDYFG